MSNALDVWLDSSDADKPLKVGTLAHDKGQIRFNYDRSWLSHPLCFALDPSLSLDSAPFFPNAATGNFGIFLDSSPDRWGQTLMQRREIIDAKNAARPARTLHAWDFLIGVQDLTRQGALRFTHKDQDIFLAAHSLPAPPVAKLGDIEAIAKELTSRRIDDLNALERWLAVLVAPGSSLGGARPKANFTETDGSLWIAKFPSKNDTDDIGAWEMVVHTLARQAQIDVPHAQVFKFGNDYHTFCVKRFDRDNGRRLFYASAMTMLGRSESEGASYLELAQFLLKSGVKNHIKADLAQLFRRVIFNIAVGNRDDHLRNHGFLLTPGGWRLAPAFDVNPCPDKVAHVLNIDDHDNRPILKHALATASFYELTATDAKNIVDHILHIVCGWRAVAKQYGLSAADIALMAPVFITVND